MFGVGLGGGVREKKRERNIKDDFEVCGLMALLIIEVKEFVGE